jgi:LuxR family maltose regulon positive regulatory protein
MKRAKIVLMAAQGEQNKTIAELLGIDPRQVSRWRQQFVHKRFARNSHARGCMSE